MIKKKPPKPITWEEIEAEVKSKTTLQPIIKVRTTKGNRQREVLVQLNEEEKKYLNYEYKPKGTWKLSLELGARRALKTAAHVAGWTLISGAAALAKGSDPLTALLIGGATAAGGSILSLSADKAVREAQKKNGQKSKLSIILDLLKELILILFRKEK